VINNILLVCIGNICRSPMAEGLFRHALPEKQVFSAGLDALVGHAADPHAVALMQARGIDIGEHRARRVEGWMLLESDLILTMDNAQKDYLESRYPAAQGKVMRLGEALRCDIPDPYRQDRHAFKHACELIEQSLELWLNPLRFSAGQRGAARTAGGMFLPTSS
jgi:protein-tyrosine phosphatase